jgi:hypothetical protein
MRQKEIERQNEIESTDRKSDEENKERPKKLPRLIPKEAPWLSADDLRKPISNRPYLDKKGLPRPMLELLINLPEVFLERTTVALESPPANAREKGKQES